MKAYLRASLALWRRRVVYRRKRLAYWTRRKDALMSRKWSGLLREAERMVSKRRAQLAPPKPTGRGKAVQWAQSKVGITERPPGSNGNPANISKWQARFGFGRCAWCGIYVGNALLAGGVKGVTSRIASVAAIEDDARARRGPFSGWSPSVRGALRGDLVVIGGRGQHVELLKRPHADGSATCLGGNTSFGPGGSQSNGGAVAERHRSAAEIHGVAHVRFGA